MDFSEILAALTVGTITAALGGIAAIKILPGFTRWGFNKVIGWFR